MPSVDVHVKTSISHTGKEYRELHEWLDLNPEQKASRHDITNIPVHGRTVIKLFGEEAHGEYIRHINDDIITKFEHLRQDFDKSITDTLAYFGVRKG